MTHHSAEHHTFTPLAQPPKAYELATHRPVAAYATYRPAMDAAMEELLTTHSGDQPFEQEMRKLVMTLGMTRQIAEDPSVTTEQQRAGSEIALGLFALSQLMNIPTLKLDERAVPAHSATGDMPGGTPYIFDLSSMRPCLHISAGVGEATNIAPPTSGKAAWYTFEDMAVAAHAPARIRPETIDKYRQATGVVIKAADLMTLRPIMRATPSPRSAR